MYLNISVLKKKGGVVMPNPIFNDNFVRTGVVSDGSTMSVQGTMMKALIMITLIISSASYTWSLVAQGFVDKANLLGFGGAIVALVAILILYFAQKAAPVLAIIYSVGEGLFLGGISAMFEKFYPGIVTTAVFATFATMGMMLLLYSARVIRYTEKFRAVILTATLSVGVIYLIQIVASIFGRSIPQIFTASPIGIGFSVVVCLIAAFNFIVDFGFIENASNSFAPKFCEWLGAVGLMTSLVWLYVEVLHLLAKLNDRS